METPCPNDGSNNFSDQWSGLIVILNPQHSSVAHSLGVKNAGRYALRVL